MLLGACCLLALLSRLLKRNEPTKLTTGGCSFRRAFGTKDQTEIKSCFEHSLSRPSSVSPPWYLRKAVLLLKAGGAPSTAVAARIADSTHTDSVVRTSEVLGALVDGICRGGDERRVPAAAESGELQSGPGHAAGPGKM
jgi:hypothetical protein